MAGNGSFMREGHILASLAGTLRRINKLVVVEPVNTRYIGENGDVVVGKVTGVLQAQQKWHVSVGASNTASLSLGAMVLPGSDQRRRLDDDILQMESILKEGDVIITEVQKKTLNGDIALQARTNRYGKLYNGRLVEVPPSLVPRQVQHILVSDKMGVFLVLGSNGFIWVGMIPRSVDAERKEEHVGIRDRQAIALVSNLIGHVLGPSFLPVTRSNLETVFDFAMERGFTARSLLSQENADILSKELEEYNGTQP